MYPYNKSGKALNQYQQNRTDKQQSRGQEEFRTATVTKDNFPDLVTQTGLEFPGSPLPLNSPFYINRPPIEQLACAEISQPGCVIRIKAPRKMGKSSLMLRLLAHAMQAGYQTVSLDFQQADEAVFANLDKFLRWFCANVSRQLKLKPILDEYWDEEIGSKVSCTLYFQGYLLEQLDSPLVLALKEVNRVFEYPTIAREFLPLLRSWHETAKQNEIMQKLRLVVVHSTAVYVSLNINQSPFNVGLPIQLSEFTSEQVQDLAVRHGLNWKDGLDAERLMAMVGGHPYLVHLALYHLAHPSITPKTPLGKGGVNGDSPSITPKTPEGKGGVNGDSPSITPKTPEGKGGVNGDTRSITPPNPLGKGEVKGVGEGKLSSLEQLLQEAPTLGGIYSNDLRSQLATLKEQPELAEALKQVVTASFSVRLEAIAAYKLESMGLVKLNGAKVTPSCELYRLFFKEQLQEPSLSDRLKQLEQENQELQRLVTIDELTQLPNRRSFNQQLEQMWQQSGSDRTPLSLIVCEIDYFKIYNETYGHLAGDFCLQQIASAIREVVSRPADLVARYQNEQFAVLLPQTHADNGVQVAQEISERVKSLAIPYESSKIGGLPASVVTVSLGVASTIPNPESDSAILVNAADQALSQSKRKGRDRISLYRS